MMRQWLSFVMKVENNTLNRSRTAKAEAEDDSCITGMIPTRMNEGRECLQLPYLPHPRPRGEGKLDVRKILLGSAALYLSVPQVATEMALASGTDL